MELLKLFSVIVNVCIYWIQVYDLISGHPGPLVLALLTIINAGIHYYIGYTKRNNQWKSTCKLWIAISVIYIFRYLLKG